jgi:hypothetical protein
VAHFPRRSWDLTSQGWLTASREWSREERNRLLGACPSNRIFLDEERVS